MRNPSVVSTDCRSGPSEILEDGKWGRLVPVGDWRAMAEAIIDTLDNPLPPEQLISRASAFSAEASVDALPRGPNGARMNGNHPNPRLNPPAKTPSHSSLPSTHSSTNPPLLGERAGVRACPRT